MPRMTVEPMPVLTADLYASMRPRLNAADDGQGDLIKRRALGLQ